MSPKNTPDYWQTACEELSRADAVMAGLITRYQGECLQGRGDAFFTLARSIVGQQISVKAADAVWGKLTTTLNGISPGHFLAASEQTLRSAGLSRQKITYLTGIAEYFDDAHMAEDYFETLSDADVIHQLTSLKGVGRWTAEMFLIFHLLRPDVLPLDDIGLQKAVYQHYRETYPIYTTTEKAEHKQRLAAIAEQSERWQPWRTVATWYLWRALDPVPVAY